MAVMLEAAIGIAVFLEDRTSYDIAMKKFIERVPAYVYLLKDGDYPKTAPGSGLDTIANIISFWQGQPTFQANGITQETCRDFVYTGSSLSFSFHNSSPDCPGQAMASLLSRISQRHHASKEPTFTQAMWVND